MTNSAYSKSRLGDYPELPHLRLDRLKLFLASIHYLLDSSEYSDSGLGSCSRLTQHQAPHWDAQHSLQGMHDESVADVCPHAPVFSFSFEPCLALYKLPSLQRMLDTAQNSEPLWVRSHMGSQIEWRRTGEGNI